MSNIAHIPLSKSVKSQPKNLTPESQEKRLKIQQYDHSLPQSQPVWDPNHPSELDIEP